MKNNATYIYLFPIRLNFNFTSKNSEFIASFNETLRQMGATTEISAKSTFSTWHMNMKVNARLSAVHLRNIKRIILEQYSKAIEKHEGVSIEVGDAKLKKEGEIQTDFT